MSRLDRRTFCLNLSTSLAFPSLVYSDNTAIVRPLEYKGALRNPLKGLRSSDPSSARKLPYASLAKSYLRWSDLEDHAGSGLDKIRAVCDAEWAGLPEINTKVIPRVYLDWPPDGHYWPKDLPRGEYETPQFRQRATDLIHKLGECWNNDPRVAFVETGIVGLWGEQHDPSPSPALQKAIGDAYTEAFSHKLLMNRYPGRFTQYDFGIYWDSFGHKEEMATHMPLLTSARLINRWKTAPMGGETAFDWGTPLGKNPTDALVYNCDAIVQLIRDLHWNHLGWLSNYDHSNTVAVANAARVQEALGYRFVLDEVRYSPIIHPDKPFRLSLQVSNTGSSPLYYNWPLEVSLLDGESRRPVWKQLMRNVDLREILPARASILAGDFICSAELAKGDYLLAVAILDPAGNKPAVRFATSQYFNGGRHPLAWIGVGKQAPRKVLPRFDDPALDALSYSL